MHRSEACAEPDSGKGPGFAWPFLGSFALHAGVFALVVAGAGFFGTHRLSLPETYEALDVVIVSEPETTTQTAIPAIAPQAASMPPPAKRAPAPAPIRKKAPTGPKPPAAVASNTRVPSVASVGQRAVRAAGLPVPMGGYWQTLSAHIAAYRHYPPDARHHKHEGLVVVGFTINASGMAENLSVLKTSGFSTLDEAALATIRRAQPLPLPPAAPASTSLPLRFRLHEGRSPQGR